MHKVLCPSTDCMRERARCQFVATFLRNFLLKNIELCSFTIFDEFRFKIYILSSEAKFRLVDYDYSCSQFYCTVQQMAAALLPQARNSFTNLPRPLFRLIDLERAISQTGLDQMGQVNTIVQTLIRACASFQMT